MTCPKCGSEKPKVIDSHTDEESIERRRECTDCKYRFNTVEIDADFYERMIKQNDKRQR